MARMVSGARLVRDLGVMGSLLVSCFSTSLWAASPTSSNWRSDYDQACKEAGELQRPVLALVTASWCGACRQMQQLTLNDSRVADLVSKGYVAVTIDSDRRPDLVSQFGVTALPTTVALDAEGKVLQRWVGFQDASSFARDLERQARPSSGGSKDEGSDFRAVSALYPTNASPYAFGGYCLVSLLEDNLLRRGRTEFQTEAHGQRVCFATAEQRDRFLANPDRYWPVANGTCLVTSREKRQEEPGDPRVTVLWKGRLWFFADQERQNRFMRMPHRFADGRL